MVNINLSKLDVLARKKKLMFFSYFLNKKNILWVLIRSPQLAFLLNTHNMHFHQEIRKMYISQSGYSG